MIQLFHRILCPIDFSEHSLAALNVALKVAQQNDAKLYLLNVAPVPAGAAGFQPVPLDPYPYLEKDRQQQLAKLARERIPGSVRYETLVVNGDPAEQVLEHRARYRSRPDRDGHARPQGIESPGPRQRRRAGRARITDAGSDRAFKEASPKGSLVFSVLGMNRQNGDRRFANDALRNAPDKKVLHSGAAMRAHHDQIDFLLGC